MCPDTQVSTAYPWPPGRLGGARPPTAAAYVWHLPPRSSHGPLGRAWECRPGKAGWSGCPNVGVVTSELQGQGWPHHQAPAVTPPHPPTLTAASSWYEEFRRLYDTVPCVEVQTLREHTDQVLHLSFSHSGYQFASCSKDCTVKVRAARDWGRPGRGCECQAASFPWRGQVRPSQAQRLDWRGQSCQQGGGSRWKPAAPDLSLAPAPGWADARSRSPQRWFPGTCVGRTARARSVFVPDPPRPHRSGTTT